MYLKKIIAIAAFILVISGCTDFYMICSLHPFCLNKNVTLNPEIEGIWSAKPMHSKTASEKNEDYNVWNKADTTSEWKIERFISRSTLKDKKGKDSIVISPQNYYTVKLTGIPPDTVQYEFRMTLFRVKKVLYADFMPAGNTGLSGSRFASESYFSVHTLARVTLGTKQADISWLSAEYMKEMIEKKHVRVNYKWVSSAKRLLLTGTSEQLTGMIEQYAGEPRFVDWENQQAMLHLNRINH